MKKFLIASVLSLSLVALVFLPHSTCFAADIEAVKNALVAKEVAPERIETVGLGESSLIASDDTEEGRKQNRRVEIVIIPVEEEVKETQQTEE